MIEKETISVVEAAQYLGVNPQSLRAQARDDKEALGFPVTIIGCHVVIPRKPFFDHLRGN